jgi:hypothetical protein
MNLKRICRQTERSPEFRQKRNEKLEIVQSERVASAGGRKGGLGGIPPALQILGEISSNFFESTPQRTKSKIFTLLKFLRFSAWGFMLV